MKIARITPPRIKITVADFAMLKQKKKNGKKVNRFGINQDQKV